MIEIHDYLSEPKMTRKAVIENLKQMVFGTKAFERFDANERETLSLAWQMLEEDSNKQRRFYMVKEIVYCDRCNKEVVYPI